MDIKRYSWGVVDSNSWLIVEDNCGLLVDAVDNKELFEEIDQLKELTVVLTHAHFDHIVGLNHIREIRPDTKVVSTDKCSEYIGNCHRNMSSIAMAFLSLYNNGVNEGIIVAPFVCNPSDMTIDSAIDFPWNNHQIRLIPTYGHSDDGLVVLVDNRMIFTGDTLLNVPTATRFPRGNTIRFLKEDIPILSELTMVDVVFPGHGNTGDIREMIKKNLEYYN